MVRLTKQLSRELWKKLPWKKFRRNLFRLQNRLYKAVRVNNLVLARKLQKLILKSTSAKMLAIRQITQLNKGKKTAGIDGIKSLDFSQRFQVFFSLNSVKQWEPKELRRIPIPKKNGKTRILSVPTIQDRIWQCLIKFSIEPAHEAIFHAKSYGFRPGRCAQDAQKTIFDNLRSTAHGIKKRVIELDIKKCFDRINHESIMSKLIAPIEIKNAIFKSLKAGVFPEFPEQGTPQGGVYSPLLANIALNGIEDIHNSVRYADDMIFILKEHDNAELILDKVKTFLAKRGMEISEEKTRITPVTNGFDFLGWRFKVQKNGKFRCTPSEENFQTFRGKVKAIVNNSNYGAKVKSQKLIPIVRGWRNYHKHCSSMDSARFSLWFIRRRAFKVFSKEKKLNRYECEKLIQKVFNLGNDSSSPKEKKKFFSENRFIKVKGDKSPYDGDVIYWTKRNSKLYSGTTAKLLDKQNHKCGYCGLMFENNEMVHLHHIDHNHNNWKHNNLVVIHQSCHQYTHME